MTFSKIRIAATALMLSVSATFSNAATLDQEFVPAITGGINPGGILVAQTFKAGLSGTLSSVSAHIVNFSNSVEDFTLSLYTTSGGIPGSSLGSVTLTASDFPTNAAVTGVSNFTSFDFSGLAINILAGTSYAIVSSTPETDNKYSWRSSTSGPTSYADGQRYTSSNGGVSWFGEVSWDFAFQTFVDTGVTPVPVPASLPLLSAALFGFGFLRRKQS